VWCGGGGGRGGGGRGRGDRIEGRGGGGGGGGGGGVSDGSENDEKTYANYPPKIRTTHFLGVSPGRYHFNLLS